MDLIGNLVTVYPLKLVLLTNLVLNVYTDTDAQTHFVDVPFMLVLGLVLSQYMSESLKYHFYWLFYYLHCKETAWKKEIACSLFALHTWQFPSNLVVCQNSLKRSATPTKHSMWMINKLYWIHAHVYPLRTTGLYALGLCNTL